MHSAGIQPLWRMWLADSSRDSDSVPDLALVSTVQQDQNLLAPTRDWIIDRSFPNYSITASCGAASRLNLCRVVR